jgi:hypothetical protein
MWIVRVLLALVALVSSGNTFAVNHYVRAGASGANTGTDWTDAFTSVPTMQRGDTYYIADGSYGSQDFGIGVSGTTLITVKKATEADHGTATGWNSTFGDGTADFTSWNFGTSYWLVDGQVGGGPGSWDTGHGFSIFSSTAILITSGTGTSNVTIKHTKANSDRGTTFIAGFKNVGGFTDYTFSYCAFMNIFGPIFHIGSSSNSTIEYSYLYNNLSTPAFHSEGISSIGTNSGWTIRYNLWDTIDGTAVIAGVNTGTSDAWNIYGNIFSRSVTPLYYYEEFGAGTNHQSLTNSNIFNNTVLNNGPNSQGGFTINVGSGNQAYNNLFYNNDANQYQWTNLPHEYTYASANIRSADGPFDKDAEILTGESNGQDGGSANPFTSYNANPLLANFTASTDTGFDTDSLLPGNTVDMLGRTRGTSSQWTRGAIQFSAGGSPPVVNGLTCSPTSVQPPAGTTSCTATTSSGTPTTWTWSVSSCAVASCSTVGTGNPATFTCSSGGACTLCALAHSADGDSNTFCTSAGYLSAKYRKPSGFTLH